MAENVFFWRSAAASFVHPAPTMRAKLMRGYYPKNDLMNNHTLHFQREANKSDCMQKKKNEKKKMNKSIMCLVTAMTCLV